MKRQVSAPTIPAPEERQFYPPKRGFDWAKAAVKELTEWSARVSDVISTHGQVRGEVPVIASAAIIPITTEYLHVSGVAAIQLLTVPPNFDGAIELIADDLWSLVVVAPPNGNIARAVIPAVSQVIRLTFSRRTGLFYPNV